MTEKFRYDLEFDEDTHWRLVRLGALSKMHQEDFLEHMIISTIETLAMDEEEGEEESTQADHIPDATKMVPPPVVVGGLVERVGISIDKAEYDEKAHRWDEARAAIFEVVKWLRARGMVGAPDLLEQEAEQ